MILYEECQKKYLHNIMDSKLRGNIEHFQNQSSNDRKLRASVKMKEHASRLKDLACMLNSTIDDNIIGNSRKERSIKKNIKDTFIPYLEQASLLCSSSANLLSPIPGINYLHNVNEANIRSEVKKHKCESKLNISKPSPQKRLELAVQKRPLQEIHPNTIPKRQCSTRKKVTRRNTLPTLASTLPKPRNGEYYLPKKVIQILQQKDPQISRTRIINHLLDNNLVPVKRTALFRVRKESEAGKVIRDDWNKKKKGKTPYR